jgi:hypothetical protein
MDEFNQLDHTAIEAFGWLLARMQSHGGLPNGIPPAVQGMSVITYRDGKAGYVLFTLLDSFATSLKSQPIKVEVEYQWGYTRIGMGDRYSLMMLANELWSLTRNAWDVYPAFPYQTRADGTVCHKCLGSAQEFRQIAIEELTDTPEKVLSGTPRGSIIS